MDWIQIIGSLGFPIVACIFLFKQNINIENQHHDEVAKISEALNNNTLIMTKLCERLGEYDAESISNNSEP